MTQSFQDTVFHPGALRTVFQPIVRLSGRRWAVHALECLTRGPAGSDFADAARLFGEAQELGLEADLDRICVETALQTVAQFGIDLPLFLNVSPATIARDDAFAVVVASTATNFGVPRDRITIEVTERGRAWVGDSLVAGLRSLEKLGIRIALDDFGFNPLDYRSIRTCRPKWIKIDSRLFRDARRWEGARKLIRSLVKDATRPGIGVIAEGLEREGDLEAAAEMGIDLVQGYLISRPLTPEHARHCEYTMPVAAAA